jgi:hypothetical protein
MPNRSQLIDDWRSRLLAAQQQCDEGSVRVRWLRRVYARIYRFLLAQYSHGETETDDAPLPEAPSAMPLVANTREHLGRPPKPIGKIQATLKHIHNASGRCDEPGPLAGGVPGDLWLAVASRRERWLPRKCAALLRRHGIAARVASRSGDTVVEVPRPDFGAAAAILESCRSLRGYRNRNVVSASAPLVYGGAGAAVGVIMGMAFASFIVDLQHDPAIAIQLIWLFAIGGAVAGCLLGCVQLIGQTTAHPATTWTATLSGGVLGAFLGMVFGYLVLSWLAVILFSIPGRPEDQGHATLVCTVFGFLCGWIAGCWTGYRNFRRQPEMAAEAGRAQEAPPAR